MRPHVQSGQGTADTASLAEAVRNSLMAYLSGPAAEVTPLASLVQVQADAEARQLGCTYVVYSSVSQKKGSSGGFAKFVAAAAPVASSIPGASGYSTGSVVASQAVAAAGAVAEQEVRDQAREEIASAAQGSVRKGDQVSFEYSVAKPGASKTSSGKKLTAKAQDDGEDVLSALIEQAANGILTIAVP